MEPKQLLPQSIAPGPILPRRSKNFIGNGHERDQRYLDRAEDGHGLTTKVGALTQDIGTLAAEVRDIDRRLVRVETIIEVTRADGSVLRIAKNPEAGGQSTED